MPKLDSRPFTTTLEDNDIMWIDKSNGLGGYADSRIILGSDFLAQMSGLGSNYYNSDLISTSDRIHNQRDYNLTVEKVKTMRYNASIPPDDSEAQYLWKGQGDVLLFDFQNSGSESCFRSNMSKQVAINSNSTSISAHLEINSGSDLATNKVVNLLDVAGTTELMTVFGDGNMVLGASSAGARLDVHAQGALATDLAFRVRNSTDTKSLMEVRGDREIRFDGQFSNYVSIRNYGSNDATIDMVSMGGIKAQISHDISSGLSAINKGFKIWNPGQVGVSTAKINNVVKSGLAPYGAGYGFNWAFTSNASGVFTQAERAMWLTDTKSLVLFNGTNKVGIGGEEADSSQMYSADIVAGNSAPHFRTENGDVIKLFKGAVLTTADATLATAITRIAELEARLQANGLLA